MSDEKTTLCWIDAQYLETFGLGDQNALDYFALSPFYDRQCNNEAIRMQALDLSHLQTMVGTEYELAHPKSGPIPGFFIINKLYRESPTKTTLRGRCYILDGKVFQAPTLQAVLNNCIRKAMFCVLEASKEINSYVRYDPRSGGVSWEFKPRTSDDAMSMVHSEPLPQPMRVYDVELHKKCFDDLVAKCNRQQSQQ
eukprot:m51a1_g11719 putative mediator of rna polymerase ii transcription subunit 6 isoform x2 (196) ;mRNA; r:94908-95815